MHDFATLELVRRAPSPGQLGADPALLHGIVAGFTGHSPLTYDAMTWTPGATHADVVRMIAKYVERQFSLPSAAGKMAIDESRVARRQIGPIDLEGGHAEVLDRIAAAYIRRVVTALPERRHEKPTPRPGYEYEQSVPLRNVAPRRDVAQMVKPRSKMGGGRPQVSVRDWCGTIAQKVKEAEAGSLVKIEVLRQKRRERRNQLADTERACRRMKILGKATAAARLEREAEAAALRGDIRDLSDQISEIARTKAYRDAPDALLRVCTETAEIEAYCFGEIR